MNKKTKALPERQSSSKDKKKTSRERIKEAYDDGKRQFQVQYIPPKDELILDEERPKLRVCAYCRVSTDEEAQQSSYELQVQHYTQYIQENPKWDFAGIYADEGISGTSVLHREHFKRMISDCRAGKIDLVITKSISRFARNVLDCLSYIRQLKQMNPPVGVLFETENLYTMDKNSEVIITVLSMVAQGESESKSTNIKWACKRRFQKGLPLCPTWALLGYDTDEYGDMVITENEAEVVRTIYQLYIEGSSSCLIAKILTEAGIPTARGNTKWWSGSVLCILKNERYCGDVLMQKTCTVDYLSHKVVRNDGREPQYFIRDHHPAIIQRKDWDLAQKLRSDLSHYKNRANRIKTRLTPIRYGHLKGFIPINPVWKDITIDELIRSSEQIVRNM